MYLGTLAYVKPLFVIVHSSCPAVHVRTSPSIPGRSQSAEHVIHPGRQPGFHRDVNNLPQGAITQWKAAPRTTM